MSGIVRICFVKISHSEQQNCIRGPDFHFLELRQKHFLCFRINIAPGLPAGIIFAFDFVLLHGLVFP